MKGGNETNKMNISVSVSFESMNSYGALKTVLLGIFLTAGLVSWSIALLQFRSSNCLSKVSCATIKYSLVSVCISFE